ncbi:MAG: ATP-binding protein [bacterium]
MISKPLDAVTKEDIESLILNQVRESRSIEYKRELPGNSDKDKHKFLKIISSFANASGGHLLYGIEAKDGIPQKATGISCDNIDEKILQLENLIRDGIAPRISGVHIKPIESFPEGSIFIIHIPKSWTTPHMVTFKNYSRFYTRNSAGSAQMDITEIRNSFALSEALPENIRRFRDEHIAKIITEETVIPMLSGPKLILYLLPTVSFALDYNLDISTIMKMDDWHPIGKEFAGYLKRINIDGVLTFDGCSGQHGVSSTYCQVYRKGIIEAVYGGIVQHKSHIDGIAYEVELGDSVHRYLGALQKLGVPCPIIILVSITEVLGVRMLINNSLDNSAKIDRDIIVLPDVVLESYPASRGEVTKLLKPIFDSVWNACGRESSLNFDEYGNWRYVY